MSTNKKPKTDETDDDFNAIREYLLQSPFGPEHPAVAAALRGLDQEAKRRERDLKLQKKFAYTAVDDYSKVEKPVVLESSSATQELKQDDSIMTDDWQDVTEGKMEEQNDMGSVMARDAVNALAQHNVTVSSPLAAVAVVLHAALLQTNHVCTGLPENNDKNGFAAPVRRIQQFLPLNWEGNIPIQLRYRKEGAMILTVKAQNDGDAQITLQPSSTTEPVNPISISIADHINLESWNRTSQRPVAPALHYKALATLLTKFAQHFDLGNSSEQQEVPYVDYTMAARPVDRFQAQPSLNRPTGDRFQGHHPSVNPTYFYPPTGIPGRLPTGDFAGDLTPSGIPPPDGGYPPSPGNLMGPNHPAFGGVGIGRMQPRFDPFGPPGGPTELPDDDDDEKQLRPRGPPGGTGVPNKDWEIKPKFNHDDNMFS